MFVPYHLIKEVPKDIRHLNVNYIQEFPWEWISKSYLLTSTVVKGAHCKELQGSKEENLFVWVSFLIEGQKDRFKENSRTN